MSGYLSHGFLSYNWQAEERGRLKEELEEARDIARRRSLGNIKFIGELFKLKMLTEAIMHDCVVKLLKNHDEESLECLCRLLTTIGKDLDFEKAKVGVLGCGVGRLKCLGSAVGSPAPCWAAVWPPNPSDGAEGLRRGRACRRGDILPVSDLIPWSLLAPNGSVFQPDGKNH